MEEIIVRQAPRSLQAELIAQIQAEKTFQASMIIGANRKHSTIERPKKNGDKKAAESKETPNSNGGQ